jgi:hypothetical protein
MALYECIMQIESIEPITDIGDDGVPTEFNKRVIAAYGETKDDVIAKVQAYIRKLIILRGIVEPGSVYELLEEALSYLRNGRTTYLHVEKQVYKNFGEDEKYVVNYSIINKDARVDLVL